MNQVQLMFREEEISDKERERKRALNKGKTVTDGEEREGIPFRPRGKRVQTGFGQRQVAQLAWNMEQLGEQQETVRL